MSTFEQIGATLRDAWDDLSEGWEQLWKKTRNAVTHFTSTDRDGHATTPVESSHWALLSSEVHEGKHEVVVRLEVPGMQATDLDVRVHNESLLVSGEKRYSRELDEGRIHIMETAYGSFRRAIPLPCAVDDSRTKATYRNGVLTITLPRDDGVPRSRIQIESQADE